jgi:hypothetical protein
MRLKPDLAALPLAALLTLPALAQIQVVISAPRGEPVTLTFKPRTGGLSSIAGRPYSATETLERTLPNGTHMPISSTQLDRDSMGRMRTQRLQLIPEAAAEFLVIEILDPVAGYQYVLDPPHQTAHRVAASIAIFAAPKTPRACVVTRPSVSTMHDGITATNEWLGLRNIEGVGACGDRITLTYPAGSAIFGNDRPVSVTSETWTAWDELGKIVLSTHSEPRGGGTTSGLKDVRLKEPDAALFRPPEGYRIVDETTEFATTLDRPSHTSSSPETIPVVTALSGLPYSAEEVLATEDTLADGTRLSRAISSTLFYRDMMGRTRTEHLGTAGPLYKVEILDSVAGYRYLLDPEKQTAARTAVRVQLKHAAEVSIPSHPAARPATEWLGTQTIDGMITYGERTTTTFAAGTMGGNDRPIAFVDERWTSPQLGIAMMHEFSAPTTGNCAATLKNLKFGEPDASLFRVPEGYRIVDDPVPVSR